MFMYWLPISFFPSCLMPTSQIASFRFTLLPVLQPHTVL